ncbi:MAG TPA: dipeptide/oligopeptide/nickel ABC transporter ATP-binding protein [Sphaerochaeta sp.]|nr:dipeptide/oligopeptide/nickel ABC transporter ATP-binding protein [Sphaerochaeta sp.]HOR80267.1 dipeptide/oligopeptide/nickel ABC transporter ATP-binding protein [Sphaerochaeta sp.]HRV23957.1 dipeptide/oligopeptide/nickel ABC transporter ATP-binding protein [Sphaerochaeta sp.]
MVVQRMIEVKSVSKAFGKKNVLSDLSFSLDTGEILGVYGKSGIGKTTLAKILCGLVLMDEGEILIDGTMLFSPTSPYDRKLGRGIQMVYQHPYASLDPNQKIRGSFSELIRYHGLAKGKEETETLILRVLSEVNLDEGILSHLPRQISGGEAQRVALARCLLLQPTLLIMDEATSMLDVMVQANVFALVKKNVIEKGGSILLISHDRDLVDHVSDRILDLEKNRVG